jgi:hypothetical protein
MNLVIAVKSQPTRTAREITKNHIKILVTRSEEAADATLLHRDATYLNKLQGTCFKCSKLNANPPQSVCGIINPSAGPSDNCLDYNDPCNCFNCPPIPPSRECNCTGGSGYLTANTLGFGSGYWIGLQANTYYSIIPNGGWVVAVSCLTGSIVGAFPVTGNNFGYGRGTILGNPVMIYPAGAVYGAGYLPQNSTSFPLLALTVEEGNELITDGNFGTTSNPIAYGSTSPGCPLNDPDYYCEVSDSTVYSGRILPCLQKYPNQVSNCEEFDNFQEWGKENGETLPYDVKQNYTVNMANVTNFTIQTSGVISFEGTSKSYCGTFSDFVKIPSDALSGACGNNNYVDPPIEVYDNCNECVKGVPCQFVVNLTNGKFNIDNGGFNANASSGFFAIGPAFPPTIGNTDSYNFWQTYWNWDDKEYSYSLGFDENGNPLYNTAFIPPLSSVENECECAEGQSRNSNFVFIEGFPCDCSSNPPPSFATVYKNLPPGISGCGIECSTRCINLNCSCGGNNINNLGQPADYGYIPCYLCDCAGNQIQMPDVGLGSIWWANNIVDLNEPDAIIAAQVNYPSIGGTLIPPNGCLNRCTQVFNNRKAICSSPCAKIFTDEDGDGIITINLANFLACTGFGSPQELLDSKCGRAYYLPAEYIDCELQFETSPIVEGSDPYLLSNYIRATDCGCPDESLTSCLCEKPEDPNCFLANISGPFGNPTAQCVQELGALFGCVVPRKEEKTFTDCSGSEIVSEGLLFKSIENELCKDSSGNIIQLPDDRIANPCGCCDQSINPTGGGQLNGDGPDVGSIECSGNSNGNCTADCCQGSDCATSSCPPDSSVIIDSSGCNSGGSTGGDDGELGN